MPEHSLAEVFNATGPNFDEVTPAVWRPAGEALAASAGLRPGDRVLDVCCGTGASAIAAAKAVGSDGIVMAIDLASELVACGRANARAAGVAIDFEVADVASPEGLPGGPFDAVICGFGVFFLPDMDRDVGRLLGVLRPGGTLAFSVWHDRALYDFVGTFVEVVRRATGTPQTQASSGPPHPITRIATESKARASLTRIGAVDVRTEVLRLRVPRSEEFCWSMVLGSGMRGHLLGLDSPTVERVRADFLSELKLRGVDEIDCDTLLVAGRRPPR